MPRLKPEKHGPQRLKRASMLRHKLEENNMYFRDLAKECTGNESTVQAYAYGYSRKKSKVHNVVVQKFGELFAEELEKVLETL